MNGKPQPLRFERVRGFGKIIGDTRNFVRDNFSVFFRSVLFIGGPFYLLTCALQTFYQVNLLKPGDVPEFNKFGSYIALSAIYSQGRWAINGLITALIISHFVKNYREKGAGKFDVSDVSRSILRDFGGGLITFLVMFFSVALISTVLGFIIFGLAEVSIGASILLIFAGALGYFLLRFPFWYFVYSVFIARTSGEKNINVFKALGIAGKVFSGNYWMTWVIFFIMWLILNVIGTAISMPAQIIASIAQLSSITIDETGTDWKLIQTILVTLGEFAKTVIDAVFMITIAMQFYNLKEKSDGEGTMKLVNTIGSKVDEDELEYSY